MTHLILLAEDNEIIVEMLMQHLTRWGYAVEVVDDGKKAVSQTIQGNPDLIIMDLVLHGMNGIEAAQAIRNLPEPKRSIPIIAFTGGMINTTVADMNAAGFVVVMQKPVLPDALRLKIKDCLGASHT